MNKTALYIAAILLLIFASCKKEEIQPVSLEEEIKTLAKSYVGRKKMPGMAIGVFNNGEQSHYFFGAKNLETGEPIDEHTVFQLASITKIVTALLYADQVVDGALTLADTANDYLPGNLQFPDKDGEQVQLLHLLNHTSGLEREPEEVLAIPYKDFDEADMSAYLSRTHLETVPGTSYEYSNTGFGLAGYILGKEDNSSFKEAVNKEILTPIGMTQTVFDWDDLGSDNIATNYFRRNIGEYENYSEVFAGAYALKSSLHDMMLFLNEALHPEASRFHDAWKLAFQPTVTMHSDHQQGISVDVGLGWHIIQHADGKQFIFHNGGLIASGSAAFLGFNPETREGVVVLINAACLRQEQDAIGFEILDKLGEY